MSSSVLRVNLALTCAESAFYGIFTVLAVTSLAVLIARHRKDANPHSWLSVFGVVRTPLFWGTVMLMCSVSAHWVTTVLRLFQAFLDYDGGQQAAAYYLIVEEKRNVAAIAFVVASVVTGDIILTYRIWVVWNKKTAMIIFPILCTMGYAGLGISVVELFAAFKQDQSFNVPASQIRLITTTALTLTTNIYGTVSIAYRIWSSNRAAKHHNMTVSAMSVSEALVIFVESAALYTCWMLFFLLSYCSSSVIEVFAFHCIPAATGISFMLIIVRVGLGFSWAEDTGGVSTRMPPGGVGAAARKRQQSRGSNAAAGGYPLRMIALSVTQTVERETDFALPTTHGPTTTQGGRGRGRAGSVDKPGHLEFADPEDEDIKGAEAV